MMYNSRIRQLIRQNMAAGQIEEYNEYKDKYRIKKNIYIVSSGRRLYL